MRQSPSLWLPIWPGSDPCVGVRGYLTSGLWSQPLSCLVNTELLRQSRAISRLRWRVILIPYLPETEAIRVEIWSSFPSIILGKCLNSELSWSKVNFLSFFLSPSFSSFSSSPHSRSCFLLSFLCFRDWEIFPINQLTDPECFEELVSNFFYLAKSMFYWKTCIQFPKSTYLGSCTDASGALPYFALIYPSGC